MGARVSVEVNAAPCKDLNKTLSEIRQEYEMLMERNLKEVEDIFLTRVTPFLKECILDKINKDKISIKIL